jgi:hypothetical protein
MHKKDKKKGMWEKERKRKDKSNTERVKVK